MSSAARHARLTAAPKVLEYLAIAASALFTGAAVYVSFVEHPARLTLDDASALQQWKPAYERGTLMQASLAIIAGSLGIASWWRTGNALWLVGAVLVLANWPYTLAVIMPTNMPTNRKLKATAPEAESRTLMLRWGRLHAGHSLLGTASLIIYLCAAV